MDTYSIVGAGHYGIIVRFNSTEVLKLFKDHQDCEAVLKEARIQNDVYRIFNDTLPQIKVPALYSVNQEIVTYRGGTYLHGIGMTYLDPPSGFDVQVHAVLGYRGSDIDTLWGMHIGTPVDKSNPPRGFFASTYTLEDIWEEEGSDMTIEKLAYLMGSAHRLMLDHGILPIDLEWVWSKGSLWAIDFGLCEYGSVDPLVFLEDESSMGLKHDLYVPHKGDRGYEEFMKGYVDTPFDTL